MMAKPQEVLLVMDTSAYFNKLATLMCKEAPPAAEDAPILACMAKIGIEPCQPFDLSMLDPAAQLALKDLPKNALDLIGSKRAAMGKMVDGWNFTVGLGEYGTGYMKRALVAAFGWPSKIDKDAVYPYTQIDSAGDTLNGSHNYTLTFAKDRR
jgi:hypothetical protein